MLKNFLILIGSLAACLFLIGISAKLYWHHLAVQKHVGSPHIFHLSEKAHGLTEELALEKAREALKLDGDDPASWQPIADPQSYLAKRGYAFASAFGPSTARESRTDEFLSRETRRPDCGIVIFLNDSGAVRFVRVGLSGSSVLCQCSAGK